MDLYCVSKHEPSVTLHFPHFQGCFPWGFSSLLMLVLEYFNFHLEQENHTSKTRGKDVRKEANSIVDIHIYVNNVE